jgi:hypothetical protein
VDPGPRAMDSVLDICKEQLAGWYDSIDRLRVGGVLRGLQQPGSVVNFMKLLYPEEERPLRHFPELTGRLTAGVERLVRQGVPYLEAGRVSDPAVQAWLDPLYAARPRAGSLVAVVRTIEGVSSFSCRPRKHPRATGNPKTGCRPVETAAHHLTRGRHNIGVYDFFVFDAHWGRASVRVASYLPFEIALQLNGHNYLERQMQRQRRPITMAANAMAHVADWKALRTLAATNLEPAVRRFGAYWLTRLPHGLTAAQLALVGGYYWYLQVLEVSHNFVFRSSAACRPLFETLLQHNHLLGSPDTIRYLFGLSRRSRRLTSSQVTLGIPMRCVKAFYGSNWLKCYDKEGGILRFELVINLATDFVANKSLSNLPTLTRLGHAVCKRLEQTCLTAVSCPVSTGAYTALVEPGTHASGRHYPAIRPERPVQQALLATIFSLAHCAAGFSNQELRAKQQQQHGIPLSSAQASYRLRTLRAHGLIEPLGRRRRYQLSRTGRPIIAFLVKLYRHLLAPVIQAATDGIHRFRTATVPDPIADALHALLIALGIAQPLPLPKRT